MEKKDLELRFAILSYIDSHPGCYTEDIRRDVSGSTGRDIIEVARALEELESEKGSPLDVRETPDYKLTSMGMRVLRDYKALMQRVAKFKN